MKITINLDESLLDDVVRITGAGTKTEAVTIALREVVRRARLVEVLRKGTGASPGELKDMFDPASDPMALRVAEGVTPYQVTDAKPDSGGRLK
ncbi:MAG: type II toxin-antitoxin system VapB family antitoxin [Verrucomicrobiales bacterium]|nr:type II toxin-antitoxin system VapB family antitoxin [Verrucomicrobiales bacterium]